MYDMFQMKVADLKKELKSRGLSVTGNKTELIERLQMAAGSSSSGTVGDASVLEEDDTALLEEADDILGEDDDTPGMLANSKHYKVTQKVSPGAFKVSSIQQAWCKIYIFEKKTS